MIALLRQRLEDRDQSVLVTPPPGSWLAGASKKADTRRRENSHPIRTDEQPEMGRRSGLNHTKDYLATPQKRRLDSTVYAENSTHSSGSTARRYRSEISRPSLTLGPSRTKHPKARRRLDFYINYLPPETRRSQSHFQPHEEGSQGRRQHTSKGVHLERDDDIVLFDQVTGEPIVYRLVDSEAKRQRTRDFFHNPSGDGVARHWEGHARPRYHWEPEIEHEPRAATRPIPLDEMKLGKAKASPFTDAILAEHPPARFTMPKIKPYEAKEDAVLFVTRFW